MKWRDQKPNGIFGSASDWPILKNIKDQSFLSLKEKKNVDRVKIFFIFQTIFLMKIVLFSCKNHFEHENPRHHIAKQLFYKLVLLLFLRNINFAQKRNAVDDDWINEM